MLLHLLNTDGAHLWKEGGGLTLNGNVHLILLILLALIRPGGIQALTRSVEFRLQVQMASHLSKQQQTWDARSLASALVLRSPKIGWLSHASKTLTLLME